MGAGAGDGKSVHGGSSNSLTQNFIGDDLLRLIQALATLRRAAQRGVESLGITPAATGGRPEIRFLDGIADADVHARFLSTPIIYSNENGSQ